MKYLILLCLCGMAAGQSAVTTARLLRCDELIGIEGRIYSGYEIAHELGGECVWEGEIRGDKWPCFGDCYMLGLMNNCWPVDDLPFYMARAGKVGW